jgi:hypothetical protein
MKLLQMLGEIDIKMYSVLEGEVLYPEMVWYTSRELLDGVAYSLLRHKALQCSLLFDNCLIPAEQ